MYVCVLPTYKSSHVEHSTLYTTHYFITAVWPHDSSLPPNGVLTWCVSCTHRLGYELWGDVHSLIKFLFKRPPLHVKYLSRTYELYLNLSPLAYIKCQRDPQRLTAKCPGFDNTREKYGRDASACRDVFIECLSFFAWFSPPVFFSLCLTEPGYPFTCLPKLYNYGCKSPF